MTTEPTSRIQVLNAPVVAPGKCVVCGAASTDDDRGYVDFGFSIKWYGVVYFCTLCFAEVAEAVDYIKNNDYLKLLKANEELEKALIEANQRIGNLNGILRDNFSDNIGSSDTLRDLSDSDEVHGDVEGSNQPSNESVANDTESSSGEGHSRVRKSSKSDRTTDIDLSLNF